MSDERLWDVIGSLDEVDDDVVSGDLTLEESVEEKAHIIIDNYELSLDEELRMVELLNEREKGFARQLAEMN